jgi:hypothetical protein
MQLASIARGLKCRDNTIGVAADGVAGLVTTRPIRPETLL